MLQKYDSASSKGFGVRWRISVRNLWLNAKKTCYCIISRNIQEYYIGMRKYGCSDIQRRDMFIFFIPFTVLLECYILQRKLWHVYTYIYIYRLQLLVESVDRPARRSDQARKWRWNTKHIVVWIENISNFDDDDDVRHPRHGGKIQPEQRKWHENWVEWNMTMNQSDRLGSGPWNAKHMNSLHEIKFNEHQERARSRRSDLATEKTKGRFGSFGCSWWKTKNAQFSCWSPRLVMPYFVRSGACENMHKWQVTRRTSGFRAPNIKKTRLGVTGGWRKRAWALVPQFPKHSRGSNRPCNDRPCRLSTSAEAGCQSMPDPMAGHADSKCIGNRGF